MSKFDVFRALLSEAHFKTLGATSMADKQPYDYAHMRRTLDSLMVAWKMNPYLRLGQLIANAIDKEEDSRPGLFFIQDDQLAQEVIKFSEDSCRPGTSSGPSTGSTGTK